MFDEFSGPMDEYEYKTRLDDYWQELDDRERWAE